MSKFDLDAHSASRSVVRTEGVSEERLRAIHAPIGLDLGGRTPAEIALSILAEISQERFGGSGSALSRHPAIREPSGRVAGD